MRTPILPLFPLVLVAAACSPAAPVKPPIPPGQVSASLFVQALRAESERSTNAAPYLDAIDAAASNPKVPAALPIVAASLDALVFGATPGAYGAAGDTAIAFRSAGALRDTVKRLDGAWTMLGAAAEGDEIPASVAPMRGLIAAALHKLAVFAGEEEAASRWMGHRGCALESSIFGPIAWSSLRSLDGASPIAAAAPLPASVPGIAPFAAAVAPIAIEADACEIETDDASPQSGSRLAVIDVGSPKAQRMTLALSSSAAAKVEVGGVVALERPFESGGNHVTRFASVEISEGWTRVVVRLAERNDGGTIEIDAWGADGLKLVSRAPRPGDSAPGTAKNPMAIDVAPKAPATDEERVLAAAAWIALGDVKQAERVLETSSTLGAPVASGASAPNPSAVEAAGPSGAAASSRSTEMDLLYSRAIVSLYGIPDSKLLARLRAAVDHVRTSWPDAWEGKILNAMLTERRKGWGDGQTEGLLALGVTLPAPGQALGVPGASNTDPLILSAIVHRADRAGLVDAAEAAYRALSESAPQSPLVAAADRAIHGRTGPEAVEAACNGALGRGDATCMYAQASIGNHSAVLGEIDRLRRLRGAPNAHIDEEIHERIRVKDAAGALALYDRLPPGRRRMLDVLGLAGFSAKPSDATERFARDRLTASDTPWSIGPLSRILGVSPDPVPPLEAEGKRLMDADRAAAFFPGAGVAVLKHTETYEIDATGFVHHVVYDLRRVAGTTDVAYGTYSYGPAIEGRTTSRMLRRRIHKKDGRVLEPDAATFAYQGASDLSQLEPGDYVEQISEGFALPNQMGQLTIDTPDLLPERTSVKEATLTIRHPSKVKLDLWSHPLLGKAEEKTAGDATVKTFRIVDAKPRRIEDGVSRMERAVSVSLGSQTWENIGRALDEQVRSLWEDDPFVNRWIDEAAGADKKPSRALVDRIVVAVGRKLRIAGGGELSDIAALYSTGSQRTTAREMLEQKQGSRSWLVYRALRSLGVQVDIAVAETEPYTTAPGYPVHPGRFHHPLVVAHLGGADGDVWIDADVEGPPLPPGRISPELRGRSAMLPGGKIVTVEGTATDASDEVDVKLTLDEKGDAKGTFKILLHGRPAQGLSEAFETVVGTERREMLRRVVLGWLPWADVEDIQLSSGEGSWEVAVTAQIKISGFGRPEGKNGKKWILAGMEPVHRVYPGNWVGTLAATYATRAARESDLTIDDTLQYKVRRHIDLPSGASIARVPSAVDVKDDHLRAVRKGTYQGSAIDEEFTMSLPTGTVPAAEYPTFVGNVQTVDSGFLSGIFVTVK